MNIRGAGDGLAAALVFLGAVLLVAKIAGQTRPGRRTLRDDHRAQAGKNRLLQGASCGRLARSAQDDQAVHIRDYSIYLKEVEPGKFYLFSYFEYTGNDFEADMTRMAADPTTQKWWKETDPASMRYRPISRRSGGAGWRRSFTRTDFR